MAVTKHFYLLDRREPRLTVTFPGVSEMEMEKLLPAHDTAQKSSAFRMQPRPGRSTTVMITASWYTNSNHI